MIEDRDTHTITFPATSTVFQKNRKMFLTENWTLRQPGESSEALLTFRNNNLPLVVSMNGQQNMLEIHMLNFGESLFLKVAQINLQSLDIDLEAYFTKINQFNSAVTQKDLLVGQNEHLFFMNNEGDIIILGDQIYKLNIKNQLELFEQQVTSEFRSAMITNSSLGNIPPF